ncbi:MAG: pro-sigmaK processing inhibitor BofA family protein [Oscillospiraceae bacterium]|nr:pro-sigmaK processing inhibitor BofA family protein [Oscillospiraceae bacterium]
MTVSLWRFVAVLGAALVLLCMLGLLAKKPQERARHIAVNAATGLFALLLINTFLPAWGISVPVNLLSIGAAGILGIPGVALAAALSVIL